jgi:anti-sigma B factor antagonist
MTPDTGYTRDSPAPDTTVVAIDGEVTFSNVVGLGNELDAALRDGARKLVVDLTAVSFIDSSGLSALLTASARARERGGALALVIDEGEPPSIFRFRGVDRLLRLYPSRAAALAGLASVPRSSAARTR